MIDVTLLPTVPVHVQDQSVLEAEHRRPILHRPYLRRSAVDQFLLHIAPEPSNAIILAELYGIYTMDLDFARPADEPVRVALGGLPSMSGPVSRLTPIRAPLGQQSFPHRQSHRFLRGMQTPAAMRSEIRRRLPNLPHLGACAAENIAAAKTT